MAKGKTDDPRMVNDYTPRQITCPTCSKKSPANAKLCPACSYVFSAKDRRLLISGGGGRRTREGGYQSRKHLKISQTAFMEKMVERGFKFVRHVDSFTGEIVREENDPQFDKLGLKFESIPPVAEGNYITQTHPQTQISMPFDTFLELMSIRPE